MTYLNVGFYGTNLYTLEGLITTVKDLPRQVCFSVMNSDDLYQAILDVYPDILVLSVSDRAISFATKVKRLNSQVLVLAPNDCESSNVIDRTFSLRDIKSLNKEILEYLESFAGADLLINKHFAYFRKFRDCKLTETEEDILFLLSCGFTREQIAQNKTVKKQTITKHVNNLTSKLNVADDVEAVVLAFRSGFVSDREQPQNRIQQ